jgi:hypothetical protein
MSEDDLTCEVVTASTDADGDAVTYTFAWDVDGLEYTGATDAATSSFVDGADVGGEETWTCEVTVIDTGGGTASASASVETAVRTYAWEALSSATEQMVVGCCGSTESASAMCDGSTVGQYIYIASGSGVEYKGLGSTDGGASPAGRGISISFSGDATVATWTGWVGCGCDSVSSRTVARYVCSAN